MDDTDEVEEDDAEGDQQNTLENGFNTLEVLQDKVPTVGGIDTGSVHPSTIC